MGIDENDTENDETILVLGILLVFGIGVMSNKLVFTGNNWDKSCNFKAIN